MTDNRLTHRNSDSPGTHRSNPFLHCLGHELRAIV